MHKPIKNKNMAKKKHDCYQCVFRNDIPYNTHSKCTAENANVKITSTYAIMNGWANHPKNFDPTWIDKCKSFQQIK
jgi:hypothetical protein